MSVSSVQVFFGRQFVNRLLKSSKILVSFHPAIPLLEICPREIIKDVHKICTQGSSLECFVFRNNDEKYEAMGMSKVRGLLKLNDDSSPQWLGKSCLWRPC